MMMPEQQQRRMSYVMKLLTMIVGETSQVQAREFGASSARPAHEAGCCTMVPMSVEGLNPEPLRPEP